MVRHDAGDMLRSVLGPALRLVAVGIIIGIAGAVLMTLGLAHLLTQLTPNDDGSFGVAIG